MTHDVIIVGGGPAGLYAALRLRPFFPRILVCEKNRVLGGRTRMLPLRKDLRTTCGAGVIRQHDRRLIRLCADLGIELTFRPSVIHGLDGRAIHTSRVVDMLDALVVAYRKRPRRVTFREFCRTSMPEGFLERLARWSGYTDYLEADAADTIFSYGFTDCTENLFSSRVDWDGLIQHMRSRARREGIDIRTSARVDSITRCEEQGGGRRLFRCRINGADEYTRRVVIATTADAYASLFPDARFDAFRALSRNVGWQPFLRLVVRTKEVMPIQGMIYTNNEYQKMYPIADRYYCVSYSDNENALRVASKSREALESDLSGMMGRPVVLSRVLRCFHVVGTHFFRPLPPPFRSREEFVDRIQNPTEGLFVVGEAVALDQGWTEGALESVERVLPRIVRGTEK